MKNATDTVLAGPGSRTHDPLTEILRDGAQRLLKAAVEAEVDAYIEAHSGLLDSSGHRLVVRNGHAKPRTIDTGIGAIEVQPPRVNDRHVDEKGERIRFTSKILPPYLRRTKSLEEFIPWLYLKGISTGDFAECLQQLVGTNTASLSPTTIVCLKEVWQQEFKTWTARSLAGKRYVYFWVDGAYFHIRLLGERQCILVVVGATADGAKEVVAIADGVRESAQSWKEILVELRARGPEHPPELVVGDGALGFWRALAEAFPTCKAQRCWMHKSGNVLNCFPRSMQAAVKTDLHQIWMASTKADADKAFDTFVAKYEAKYPKATDCLKKDRDELLAFYDVPAEHWRHIRTTNPIESAFATVRLRHRRTKGSGSPEACLAMVFKLIQSAQRTWRRLNGAHLLRDLIEGVTFKDGIKVNAA